MKGTRMWKPAPRVSRYVPSRSTTKALCWGTTTADLAMTTRTSTASTTATTTASVMRGPPPGEAPPDASLLSANPQRQPLHPGDPAPLPGMERQGAGVVGGPGGAAQLDLPHGPGGQLLHRRGHLALERIHGIGPLLGVHPAHQVGTHHEEGGQGDGGEEHPLEPRGYARPETARGPHHEGADGEEDDVEPAGGEHLRPEQHEPQQQPQPPRHARPPWRSIAHGPGATPPFHRPGARDSRARTTAGAGVIGPRADVPVAYHAGGLVPTERG